MPSEWLTPRERVQQHNRKHPHLKDAELYQRFIERGIHQNTINRIQKLSRGQGENPNWKSLRWGLVTASKFKKIVGGMSRMCKQKGERRAATQESLLRVVFEHNDFQSEAMKWGLDKEKDALDMYWEKYSQPGRTLLRPGLYVSSENPLVGASPDGVVRIRYPYVGYVPLKVVEVKCPFNARDDNPQDVALAQACEVNKYGEIVVKTNHTWNYQMQAQMGVLGVDRCDLVVYTNRGICRVKVWFDEDFFKHMMDEIDNFIDRYVFPKLSAM